MHKVIFDTDPGIDDAMALLFLAAASEAELIGITTTFGNGTIETTTRNALYLAERFGIAAPVAQGAGVPLVKQVVIMGGAFGIGGVLGNVTPAAEANIWGDPLAADEVTAAAWPLVMAGLDVTQRTRMPTAYLRALAEEAGEAGRFIWDISRFYEDFHRQGGVDSIYVHDSSDDAYLLEPTLIETRRGAIRVISEGLAFGQTIQKPAGTGFPPSAWDHRPEHLICTSVDSERLKRLYADTLRQGLING